MNDETAIVVASPLDLIEALDDQQIIIALQGASDAAVQTWCYSFQQDGQPIIGMSIDGVQEAAREMARRGDVIDQDWVKLDRETEREAFFTCKAVRYAVSPDGQRVQMDSAIRSKRVDKYTKLRNPRQDGSTEVFNRYWYEVGTAKAARNAVEALLPEGIKQWMIETAKKGGNVKDVTKERRTAAQHRTTTTEAPKSTNPKQVVLDQMKAARNRNDWPQLMAELVELFPRWVDGNNGAIVLSECPPADVKALNEFLETRLKVEDVIDGEVRQGALA